MVYLSDIRKVWGLLHPTGRAWQFTRGSENTEGEQGFYTDGVGATYVDGLGIPYGFSVPGFDAPTGKQLVNAELIQYEEAYSQTRKIIDSVLPDNNNFDEKDADDWERVFELPNNLTDLEERKARIAQKLYYPNGIVERSTAMFMQEQLQALGFNVIVTENRFWNGSEFEITDPAAIATQDVQCGLSQAGDDTECGGEEIGVDYSEIIANYVDPDKDASFFDPIPSNPVECGNAEAGDDTECGGDIIPTLSREVQLQASFFVGGGFPSFVDLPLSRREEFRQTILKYKPAQTICFAYINWI